MITPTRKHAPPQVLDAILAHLIALDQRATRIETRLVVLANAMGHGSNLTPKEPDRAKGTV